MPRPHKNIFDRIRRFLKGEPAKKEEKLPCVKPPKEENEDEEKLKRKKRWMRL